MPRNRDSVTGPQNLHCFRLVRVRMDAVIRVEKYLHATILVRDLERTRTFYTTVLGLEEIERPRFNFTGTWFAVGDTELHIVVKPDLAGDPAFSDDRHIAFGVADFEGVPEKLRRLGIPFRVGTNPARRQIFFRDPDGNLIELQPA
ncbi:MAG: glyoxalase [Acidobacteria bacterium]|nr:MAG: glyoxalase [Acidobacteriota bacterium]